LPVGVERPGFPGLLDLKPRLVVAIDQRLTGPSAVVRIGERDGATTVPFDLNDLERAIGNQTADTGTPSQLFKTRDGKPLLDRYVAALWVTP
jgi:hypothetical protein